MNSMDGEKVASVQIVVSEAMNKPQRQLRRVSNGSGGWDRTNDLVINSHPLFR